MYYIHPLLIAKVWSNSKQHSEFIGIKSKNPVAVEKERFCIEGLPLNLKYTRRYFYRHDIMFIKSDRENIDKNEIQTLLNHVSRFENSFRDISVYTFDIDSSFANVNSVFNSLYKIADSNNLSHDYSGGLYANFDIDDSNKYTNNAIEKAVVLKRFDVGMPYYIKLNNHPKAHDFGAYYAGKSLICIESNPYYAEFVKVTKDFYEGKIMTDKIRLTVEDIINYDVDIIKMVTIQALANDLDNVLLEIDKLQKYYLTEKPTVFNTDSLDDINVITNN